MSPTGVLARLQRAKISVHTAGPLVAAEASDSSGKVLGTSPTVPTNYTPPGRAY